MGESFWLINKSARSFHDQNFFGNRSKICPKVNHALQS